MEQLWAPDDPGLMAREGQFYMRFDSERFTLHGQANHPVLQIYSAKGQPQAYRFPHAPELPVNAAATTTHKFIRRCLEDCVRNHIACRKAGQGLDPIWPKRVLQIDPSSARVRLVPFNKSMDQQYTALSYCWGPGQPPFKATQTTLPALRDGISVKVLPRTIADAVRFSLQIGCTLIWVDSLCIVQDDPADWDEESGKMSTVYQRALATLITSSAATCNDGFLQTEREGSVLLCPSSSQHAEVRARKLCEVGHHQPQSFLHSAEYRRYEPIDVRGWTLQEKRLSPRCVIFTDSEVQWECHAAHACECGQAPSKELAPPPSPSPSQSPPLLTREEEEWFDVLHDYTNRRLTVNTDRLTALAGVSRAMARTLSRARALGRLQQQQQGRHKRLRVEPEPEPELGPETESRFAAGIWMDAEPSVLTMRGLLWTRAGAPFMQAAYCPPQTYLAPSWSWASIVGEVNHLAVAKFAAASYPTHLVEVDLTAATADPFGRVTFGFMRVNGPLLRAGMVWKKGGTMHLTSSSPDSPAAGSCDVDCPLERVPMPRDGGRKSSGFTVQRQTAASAEESERLFAITEFPETEVFVLPIMEYVNNWGALANRVVESLVLGRSPTLPGYQRLGTISMDLKNTRLEDISVPEDVYIF
ncbi:hypothetical protein SLS62_009164 [Diatrype stigma]|uniref:Heterokaryon incompatibility domain-containing protein n=1 Tax=Diatrype stigma TaxID=117547 RepID=A0AAN9YLI5_9PEZI